MNAWITFGLLTGVIVHTIYPYNQKGGAMGAVLVGTFGALIGGLLGA